jgi:hypothetical protein
MAKIGIIAVVALGIVGALLGWSSSEAVIGSPPSHISIQEMHALAHLEGLPVQHFEDAGVSYPVVAQK